MLLYSDDEHHLNVLKTQKLKLEKQKKSIQDEIREVSSVIVTFYPLFQDKALRYRRLQFDAKRRGFSIGPLLNGAIRRPKIRL
jgi:hypothetical protein